MYTGTKGGYFSQYPWQEAFPKTGFDPRVRPWYENAIENKDKTVWSIYVFATPRVLGYTCSKAIYNANGDSAIAVCAADIQLSTMLGTIKDELKLGDLLIHFIYTKSNNYNELHVLWASENIDKRFDDWKLKYDATELNDSLIKQKIDCKALLFRLSKNNTKKGYFNAKYGQQKTIYTFYKYDWDYIGKFNNKHNNYQAACLLITKP